MQYLADERMDKRRSLKEIWNECESVIVFLFSYAGTKKWLLENYKKQRVAGFTLGFSGVDYHYKIKESLVTISEKIKKQKENIEYKICVDTYPVLERDLAVRAGLGWVGKSSMLIHPTHGSYTIIGSILLNQKFDLPQRGNVEDQCHDCSKCVESCPTQAICNNRTIDAGNCISNFTTQEKRQLTPPNGYEDTSYIFGCDVCMDVCPYNENVLKRILPETTETEQFNKLVSLFQETDMDELIQKIGKMSGKEYQRFMKQTSFERAGKKGLLKNLNHT